MYSRILDFYTIQTTKEIENLFSYHMQSFGQDWDKEKHLRNMFADIFAEKDLSAVEPYVHSTADEFLKLFY